MDKDLIEKGLKRTATPTQRVQALVESGFSTVQISEVTKVTPQTVRMWLAEENTPRKDAYSRLDKLRSAMGQLVTRGLGPDEAANWLQSISDEPPFVSPLEVFNEDPSRVFEMIREDFGTPEG